eukprot:10479089-Alexandrium_andersonii.AAC.1
MSKLADGMYGWHFSVEKMDAKDFGLAQNRPRVYILGRRVSSFKSPMDLEIQQLCQNPLEVRLTDFLDSTLPHGHPPADAQHQNLEE